MTLRDLMRVVATIPEDEWDNYEVGLADGERFQSIEVEMPETYPVLDAIRRAQEEARARKGEQAS